MGISIQVPLFATRPRVDSWYFPFSSSPFTFPVCLLLIVHFLGFSSHVRWVELKSAISFIKAYVLPKIYSFCYGRFRHVPELQNRTVTSWFQPRSYTHWAKQCAFKSTHVFCIWSAANKLSKSPYWLFKLHFQILQFQTLRRASVIWGAF